MAKQITELVTKKLIQCGDVIEVFEYSQGYLKGFNVKPGDAGGRVKDYTSEEYTKHRQQVMQRAKTDLRRLINSNHNQYGKNITSKFLTLTFADNVTDIPTANYEFKKFRQRLNYQIFNTKKSMLKYNVVVEFTKAGRVHYHVIIYNIPFTKWDLIERAWGNGFIRINKISNVDNVGAYVTAYMGKDLDDTRLQGQKSYFSSRGLLKPIEITDKKRIETVVAVLPSDKIKYSSHYSNDYLGDISYKQYNLSDI